MVAPSGAIFLLGAIVNDYAFDMLKILRRFAFILAHVCFYGMLLFAMYVALT